MIFRLLLFLTTLSALLPMRAIAVDYEVVAQYERPGTQPFSRLVYVPASGAYFGTTSSGGAYGLGTVFKWIPGSDPVTLVSFTGASGAAKGAEPDSGLVLGADGLLYGTTPRGGSASDCGTIFRISTTGTFASLATFTGAIVGSFRGAAPNELILSGSVFYGTTQGGGFNGEGTLYSFTAGPGGITSSSVLVEFTGTSGSKKGSIPVGSLTVSGTFLYGVTYAGGNIDAGTVFRYNTSSNAFSSIHEFGATDGAFPADGLVVHPNGSLYGTTEYGGATDGGTVFQVSGSSVNPAVFEFDDLDGAAPAAKLLVAPDPLNGATSALYGTTSTGGLNGFGTVFKFTIGAQPTQLTLTTLTDFTGESGARMGDSSRSSLILAPNGDLVGTTSAGGGGNYGTLFEVGTQGGVFAASAALTLPLGWSPTGVPAFDTDGLAYFPMRQGGEGGCGTVLAVTSTGTTALQGSFESFLGEGLDGGLLFSGGNFYGVASDGGLNSRGTIYQFSPTSAPTVLSNMTISAANPEGPLTQGPDGYFYGVARESNAGAKGVILRVDSSTGARTALVSFTGMSGAAPGETPRAPLVISGDGFIYGVTQKGGANDKGTVFKLPLSGGSLTTLVNFTNSGPNSPLSGLTAGATGEFFGTTEYGGASGFGTVFKVTSTGTLSTVVSFTGTSGAARGSAPLGALVLGLDGTIFGTTAEGGTSNAGTIFRIKDGAFSTLFDFTGTTGAVPGAAPKGGLIFGPDGMIYGCTEEGGPRGGGVLFRIKKFGPLPITDEPSYPFLIATLNGRAQTGGTPTDVWFEVAILPLLLPLNLSLPASSVEVNGTISFSLPLSLSLGDLIYFRACAKETGTQSIVRGLTRTLSGLTPLQSWKTQFLGNANAPDLDDPDHDGRVNLAEYAFLRNPVVAEVASPIAPMLRNYVEGTRLAVFVQRDPARSDIKIEVQTAASPAGPWTTVATSLNGAPFSGAGYVTGDANTAGIKTVEIRDVPPGGATARFMRVLATH